jgi:type I restriction enzyme S subunit
MSIENGTVPQDNCQHFNEEYLMSSIKIKKDTSLRKAILQAAITGQLISDVEGETETGKQLLDRIIEERKNKLSHGLDFANAKSGKRKSKKETALAGSNPCDIPEDEIPFEIPENWCWCRLGEIIDLLSGRDLEPSEYNSLSKGIPYMTGASNFESALLLSYTSVPASSYR